MFKNVLVKKFGAGVFYDLDMEFETLWDSPDRKTVLFGCILDDIDSIQGLKIRIFQALLLQFLLFLKIRLFFVIHSKFFTAGVPL